MAQATIYSAAVHPLTVHLGPGEYNEPLNLVPYVSVVGAGTGETKIRYYNEYDPEHFVVRGAEGARLESCTVAIPGFHAAVTVLLQIDDVSMEVADVVFSGNDNLFSIGLLVSGENSSDSVIRDSVIERVQRFRNVDGWLVKNSSSQDTLAECNDRGVYARTAIAAKISGPVDFEPFLGNSDVDGNGDTNAVDVQLVINAALGVGDGNYDCDVDESGAVDAVDVQMVINAALGKGID